MTQDLSGGAANDQTYGFSYTAASQIAQRTAANDNYNWTGPNVTRTYNRNGLNQYTSVSGTSFTYDTRGNLTSDGSRTFAYDLENRLLSVSGSANLALSYDPLGRLRSTTAAGATTDFLYDGDRLVAEYNSSGAIVRRYVHGPGVDEPLVWYEGSGLTDRRWLAADHLGSIIATNDNIGATTIQSYGPYGEPLSWSGPRFRYTGQMALPEVQLYHYRARVFDPILGRFLQTDPIGYEDDFNLYAYVGNDPLNNSDPLGRQSQFGAMQFEERFEAQVGNRQDLLSAGMSALNQVGNNTLEALNSPAGQQVINFVTTMADIANGPIPDITIGVAALRRADDVAEASTLTISPSGSRHSAALCPSSRYAPSGRKNRIASSSIQPTSQRD